MITKRIAREWNDNLAQAIFKTDLRATHRVLGGGHKEPASTVSVTSDLNHISPDGSLYDEIRHLRNWHEAKLTRTFSLQRRECLTGTQVMAPECSFRDVTPGVVYFGADTSADGSLLSAAALSLTAADSSSTSSSLHFIPILWISVKHDADCVLFCRFSSPTNGEESERRCFDAASLFPNTNRMLRVGFFFHTWCDTTFLSLSFILIVKCTRRTPSLTEPKT